MPVLTAFPYAIALATPSAPMTGSQARMRFDIFGPVVTQSAKLYVMNPRSSIAAKSGSIEARTMVSASRNSVVEYGVSRQRLALRVSAEMSVSTAIVLIFAPIRSTSRRNQRAGRPSCSTDTGPP